MRVRGQIASLETVTAPSSQPTVFYLERASIEALVGWVRFDERRRQLLATNAWTVKVFGHQLREQEYVDYRSRRKELQELNLEIVNKRLQRTDSTYVEEVKHAYFHVDAAEAQQRAEFLVLVRRTNGSGWANIISQHRSFQRIPFVNAYFNGTYPLVGEADLPVQFDFLTDLDIPPRLAQAIRPRIDEPDYGNIRHYQE